MTQQQAKLPQYGPINPRAPFIWHGGDYNPEQWPPATWDTDFRKGSISV